MPRNLNDFLIQILLVLFGNAVFVGLKLLGDIHARLRETNEIIGQDAVLHFGFSPLYKALSIFATLMCGTGALVALWHQLWGLVLLGFVAACFFFSGWYYMSGQVIVDPKGITLYRFSRRTRICYPEIVSVKHHRKQEYVLIRGRGKKIRVDYQLDSFEKFERAVDFYYNKVMFTRDVRF